MPLEIVGMVGTKDASEVQGPLVDGPVVDWSDGPVIEPSYVTEMARAHEASGFDRVLIGYGAVGPDGWPIAAAVLAATERLRVLVAHRPGLVQPSVLARQAATLDHLSGGGRIAVHFITGGDEADQRREGDHVVHDARYRRTGEVMEIVRRLWSSEVPFDYAGEFYRYDDAFTSVKPATPAGIPFYFAGASAPALAVGTAWADVYAFWGEPLAATAERIAALDAAAAQRGRQLRYSVSLRPIVAATEGEAWERAEWVAETTAARIAQARERVAELRGEYVGLGSAQHATFAVDRKTEGTSSEGRKRLIAMSSDQDRYDERLWMKVAYLTGAAGNSTALVGTAEHVAEALLRYCDLGVSTFILKGFAPLDDVRAWGDELIPRLRAGAAARLA